ncbi:MAG: 4-alpha-glucanotransferase [Myxococcota bacterium]
MREREALEDLAAAWGVQTSYRDVKGREQHASPEALIRVLQALGARVDRLGDAPEALRARRQRGWREITRPVHAAWEGAPASLEVRLPADATGAVACSLSPREVPGDEGPERWTRDVADLPVSERAEVEGVAYVSRTLRLPRDLAVGYWDVTLETPAGEAGGLLVVAPRTAMPPTRYWPSDRTWGVFLPLYALPTRRGLGVANLSDLGDLMAWVHDLGGSVVGTLPLSAAFLREPFEPSPYAPASRLFWNEAYLDLDRAPELATSPEAREALDRARAEVDAAGLSETAHVRWREIYGPQRGVLRELSRVFFEGGGEALPEFRRFCELVPMVGDYARFRGATEAQGRSWHGWPERMKRGDLREGDWDEEERRLQLYAQYLAHEQLRELGRRGRDRGGVGLYMDLPLGAHPDSFDLWRWQDTFALDMSLGAPPDLVFSGGQSWGLPPLAPERLQQTRYEYVVESFRAQMRYATVMRLDHVMGLHRQFWVPSGMSPTQGVYVRHNPEVMYAILCLESRREGCVLIGEDLGTVPGEVRHAMAEHGLRRMFVAQLEVQPEPEPALPPVPEGAVASIGTHDMPPFAAWWEGLDIDDRTDLGLYDEAERADEHAARKARREALVRFLEAEGLLGEDTSVVEVLRAVHRRFAEGDAGTVLVNLEDLWLEREPQNVPGTWRERPNWVRRARMGVDDMRRDPGIREALRAIDRLRRGEGGA